MRVIERGNTLVPNVAFNSSLSLLNFGVEGNGQNTFTPGTIVVSCLSAAFAVICEILICTMKNCVHNIHTQQFATYTSPLTVPLRASGSSHEKGPTISTRDSKNKLKDQRRHIFRRPVKAAFVQHLLAVLRNYKKRPQKSYRDRIKFSGSLTSRKPDFVCVIKNILSFF